MSSNLISLSFNQPRKPVNSWPANSECWPDVTEHGPYELWPGFSQSDTWHFWLLQEKFPDDKPLLLHRDVKVRWNSTWEMFDRSVHSQTKRKGGATRQLGWTTNPLCNDFVLQANFTIFWHSRVLRVHLDLYALDFPKIASQYFLHPSTFKSITTNFGGFFGKRNRPNHVKYILAKTFEVGQVWMIN